MTNPPENMAKYRRQLWSHVWGRLWRLLGSVGLMLGFFYWAWHIERKGGVGWDIMVDFIEWFGPWGKWIIPALIACAALWHLYHLARAVLCLATGRIMEFPPLPGSAEDRDRHGE